MTLFGGEPLLPGDRARKSIQRFLDLAAAQSLSVAVVTNGYMLRDYLETLQRAAIREVQVTLDGVGGLHDRRRPLRGGLPTFQPIVDGVDEALKRGIPINLRVVLDRENIHGLPELARFARDRGWTGNPLFKTQLGRNYELHTCQADPGRLYTRVELYQELSTLASQHPEVIRAPPAGILPGKVPLGERGAARALVRLLSRLQDGMGVRLRRPHLFLHCDRRQGRRRAGDILSAGEQAG